MVDGFPYEVPEEYQNMPLLKGRAEVDMKVKVKDNPNLDECVFHIVLDGYNAPVTAGNFVDLVERHFYDGMEIQRGKKSDIYCLIGHGLQFCLIIERCTVFMGIQNGIFVFFPSLVSLSPR